MGVDMTSQNSREFNFWFLVEPASDLPGQWVAHCLELDVVSQGNNLHQAHQMLMEACAMVLIDDLVAERDIYDRRAPKEFWDRLFDVVRHGKPCSWADVERFAEERAGVAVGQLLFEVKLDKIRPSDEREAAPRVPIAWTNTPCDCQLGA